MKKLIFILCIIMFSFTACSPSDNGDLSTKEDNVETRIVVDTYGREVEIPSKVDKIICVGSNSLRMVTYLNGVDMLVGVEDADKAFENSTKRDYAYVNYDKFKDLPSIGKGGGTAYTAYPEEILKYEPDVILSTYVEEAVLQLENETGIPVVSIRNGSVNFIDENFYSALRLTGDVIGKEERCEELLSYIDECKADLKLRSEGILDEDKPKVYTGAVTFSGAHGFSGTYANFGPFIGVGAKNVADETGEKSAFEVDLEKVVVWDPDIIFLDPGNMNLVNEEYKTNPDYFNSLKAVKNGEVYTMPSFNNYSTNITYCLLNSYHTGKVLYPDNFSDIVLRDKGNEILSRFLGREYFDEMEEDGLYYGKIKLGE